MSDNNGKRKVCKCGSNVFRIIATTSCDKCHCNGVWDDEETSYTHDLKIIKKMDSDIAVREQCGDEGECDMGSNENNGCWLFECVNCDSQEMIPRTEV